MTSGVERARVPAQRQVPRLRGALHAVAFPVAVTAGVVLVVLATVEGLEDPVPLAHDARPAANDRATTAAPLRVLLTSEDGRPGGGDPAPGGVDAGQGGVGHLTLPALAPQLLHGLDQ